MDIRVEDAIYRADHVAWESARFAYFRATGPDGFSSIVKVLKPGLMLGADYVRMRHEVEMMQHLGDTEGALAVTAHDYEGERPTLVFAHTDARCLADASMPMALPDFLYIAPRVCQALATIHSRHVVHKDIKPHNILVGDDSAMFINFGIAAYLGAEQAISANRQDLEGTLAYMAPEQTGRLNHVIDYRSDLYSLGVTFFELLTGRLPFAADDPLAWMHAHIAKTPPSMALLRPEIPAPLCNIVRKLLNKTGDDRYQSALGLAHDLTQCRSLFEAGGAVDAFELGTQDVAQTLHLSQTLYGRQQAVDVLTKTFETLLHEHTTQVLSLSAPSGMGKSALVYELYKPILRQRGFFVAGKFDQIARNRPYSGMFQALRDLCNQLVKLPDSTTASVRASIRSALGVNGAVLLPDVPELSYIIGEQAPVVHMAPSETLNRFLMVFNDLLRAIATKRRPLVLFLDDMQWADRATLALLESICSTRGPKHLLVILAYRSDEVSKNHPLTKIFVRLREAATPMHAITLGALQQDDICRFLEDSLRQQGPDIAQLAGCVWDKTQGNPLFVTEFVKTIYFKTLLRYDLACRTWAFDLAAIATLGQTDNVLHILSDRIQNLGLTSQRALSTAAFLGNIFEVEQLALVLNQDAAQTMRELQPSIDARLLVPATDRASSEHVKFAFRHDRIQQASLSLTDASKMQSMHLTIAERLDESPAHDSSLYDIANHYNLASGAMTDPSQRAHVYQINRRAGYRAKSSAAFDLAFEYFLAASHLVPIGQWRDNPAEALDMRCEILETGYLSNKTEVIKPLFDDAVRHTLDPVDCARLDAIEIRMLQNLGDYAQCAKVCCRALKNLGIELPQDAAKTADAMQAALGDIRMLETGYSAQALVDSLPPLNDRPAIAQLSILRVSCAPLYIAMPNVFALAVLVMARITLKHGLSPVGAYAISGYGMLLACIYGDIERGYDFAKAAVDLNVRLDDLQQRGAVVHVFGDHVNFFKAHYDEPIPLLKAAFKSCSQSGDFESGNYIGFQLTYIIWEKGQPLEDAAQAIEPFASFAHRSGSSHIVATISFQQLAMAYMQQGDTSRVFWNSDEAQRYLAITRKTNFTMGEAYCAVVALGCAYILGDTEQALRWGAHAEPLDGLLLSTPTQFASHFYYAMARAHAYADADEETRTLYYAYLTKISAKFTAWSGRFPANALTRAKMLESEVARLDGRLADAMALLEEAREAAHQGRFVHHEALANELAARLYAYLSLHKVTAMYLRDAHRLYRQWGAHRKVTQMEIQHPELANASDFEETETAVVSLRQIDLLSILKASQNISAEMVLSNLLTTMMNVVLEYTGAQRGALILIEDNELQLTALADADNMQAKHAFEARPITTHDSLVAAHIVRTVWRSGQELCLGDAQGDSSLEDAAYLQRNAVKSILCYPITRNGVVTALFYLENNLAAHIFKPEQLLALRLLAAQVAISIDNSRLYKDSQQAIKARDAFLSIASHELKTPLTPLRIGVQSLSRNLKRGRLDSDKLGAWAHRAEVQIDRLNRLINDLLDLSRLESGGLTLERGAVDLAELVDNVVGWCHDDLERSMCAVNTHFQSTTGQFDRARLEQVVTNLVLNAAKYAGGTDLELRVYQRGDEAVLEVADRGPGISATYQKTIFDRFARGEARPSVGGLGLGLFICRQIVEAHGGQITVQSEQGEGSTFCVALPMS